jgi:oxygen-dependent protoporphyrinogen oxidase
VSAGSSHVDTLQRAPTTAHVAIVGGGIAGLATAFAIQEQGARAQLPISCTIFEAGPTWGGKILTHRVEDFIIEAGPDSFLSQKPWALELIADLGLSDRLINTNEFDKKTFIYSRGQLRELPEGLVMGVPTKLEPFLRGGLISPLGMARMAMDYVLPRRRSQRDESLASFFSRRLGREAFERLVEPLMGGIYAGDAEQMSLRATFPRFLEIEQQYGSLIRGMLAGRKRASAAPSGHSLSPDKRAHTMFVTLKGGLGELVESLLGRLRQGGVQLASSRRINAIRVRSSRLASWTYDLLSEGEAPVSADAVVLATPAFVSADLVRALSPLAAGLLEQIPYASTATVSLAYRADMLKPPPQGFGFVVPRVEGRDLIAATWSSSKWPHRAPPSHALIRSYVGGIGRERMLEADDAELIRRVRQELQQMTGLTGEPMYAEVTRWPAGMPQYTVGHLDRLATIQESLDRYAGLLLIGAAYRGIGIPDCIRDGTEAAGRLIKHLNGVLGARAR